jgi:hypothetical protein
LRKKGETYLDRKKRSIMRELERFKNGRKREKTLKWRS